MYNILNDNFGRVGRSRTV